METEKLKEEVIEIKGMHCNSCVTRIEEKLLQMKGVNRVKVNLVEEKAYITFNPKKIDLNKIKAEIELTGYKTESNNDSKETSRSSSLKQGLIYGLIPHIGCIAFIIGSILGVTVLTQLFRPLLMNRYFFHILIGISFLFATISAIVYLKKQGFIKSNRDNDKLEIGISKQIIKRKWKYLSLMYGLTIGVNLLLFFVIFPLLANVSLFPTAATGAFDGTSSSSSIRLKVDIPCSGHASLISGEIKTINGIEGVKFSFPDIFDVKYDPTKTSKEQILSLEVFKTYSATALDEPRDSQQVSQTNVESSNGIVATTTNGVQKVQLSVKGSTYYPYPIRVKKGTPVQLVADISNMPGCSKSIIIPEYGIRKVVSAGDNVIEFTPDKSGTFKFSCSMVMYIGQIIVEEADGSVSSYTEAPFPNGGACGGGSGGCGCGG